MEHNQEKNLQGSHGFNPDVVKENIDTPDAIKVLTPEGKKRLNFFKDLIKLAVEEGKIDDKTAKLITLTSDASARTVNLQ